jgi:hypothetical protein
VTRILVSHLRVVPPNAWAQTSRLFANPADVEALHKFAREAIGLDRAKFIATAALPHYDLVLPEYFMALQAGAHLVTMEETMATVHDWNAWHQGGTTLEQGS